MKRKFSNRNEPIAELVAARLRGKRILRASGLEPRVNRFSPVGIVPKKHKLEKLTDRNITDAKRNSAVSKSLAM